MAKKETPKNLQDPMVTLSNNIDFGNFLSTLNGMPNPNTILRKAGKTLKDAYELVSTDDRVNSCMETRIAGIARYDQTISGGDPRALKLCEEVFQRLGYINILKAISPIILWGYQPIQYNWDVSAGPWTISKLDSLPQWWFTFNSDGVPVYYEQSMSNMVELEKYKVDMFQRGNSYINPYGTGLFPQLYWTVYFKKEATKMYLDALERFGKPTLYMEHSYIDSDPKISAGLEQLRQLRNGGVAMIPEGNKITPISTASMTAYDTFQTFIRDANDSISINILGGNLTSSVDGGSYAASKMQRINQENREREDCAIVKHFIDTIFRYITDLNFGTDVESPVISLDLSDDITADQATVMEKLQATGVVKFTAEYFKRNFDLKDDEFSVVEPVTEKPASFAEGDKSPSDATFDAIDNALAQLTNEELESMASGLYKPVVNFIKKQGSYADMLSGLAAVYGEMDSSAVDEYLYKTNVILQLIGKDDVKKEGK